MDAEADFTRALALDKSNARALGGRARTRSQLGQHKAAREDWTAVIALASDNPAKEAAYLERGACALAGGDTQDALADYDRALELNPRSIAAHIARAGAYAAAGDREQALREYERGRQIDPTHAPLYVAKAQSAERWGDARMAVENYRIALEINPRGAWIARLALKRLGVNSP